MKKIIFLAVICQFAICNLHLQAQNVNIPDANFKAALLANSAINTNSDGEIQISEATAFTGTIDVSGLNINDLTGINSFVELTELYCLNNQITSLDVTGCAKLERFFCINNTQLNSLNVSGCAELTTFQCDNNNLNDLNLSGCTKLAVLYCNNNQLTNLDVTSCVELFYLYCNFNQLTNLNLSTCINLRNVDCQNNQLSNLNISNKTFLQMLNCNSNQITSLDVSNCPNLYALFCGYNLLSNIDLRTNTGLERLFCYENQLTNLNLSFNTTLRYLNCYNNQLNNLNVSGCSVLYHLECNNNQLSNLSLVTNTGLARLECNNNLLTTLNLAACTNLIYLTCGNNQLMNLNLSANLNLDYLYCNNNQITTLDISNNIALRQFQCAGNQLTFLNVKSGYNNPVLYYFDAKNNPNLYCIQVDNVGYSNNWYNGKDPWASYNELCLPPCDYELPATVVEECGDDFCIPINATASITSGVIGMDICMSYDPAVLTPTGIINLGNVVHGGSPSYADYFVSTNNGEMNISIYYNGNGPANTEFSGTGTIGCVEFTLNAGVPVGTVSPISLCGIDEGTNSGSTNSCSSASSTLTVIPKTMFGTIQYRNNATEKLIWDSSNPSSYIRTDISSANVNCASLNQTVNTDLNGEFNLPLNNETNYKINRDIAGDYYNTTNSTNVMSWINGADALLALRIATKNMSLVPNVYQIIAADVNMDGIVRANDVTLINRRATLSISEFPQAWNYNAAPPTPIAPGMLSYDWLFVEENTITNNASFQIDPAYPNASGTGFSRDAVPSTLSNCLAVNYINNGTCVQPQDVNIHAILLGDIDGNWTQASGASAKTDEDSPKIVYYDINKAEKKSNGNLLIPVYFKSDVAVDAVDFTIDYNEDKISLVNVLKTDKAVASNVVFNWNNYESKQLLLSSYLTTSVPVGTSEAVFSLEIASSDVNNMEADFGNNITSYINGEIVASKVIPTENVTSIENKILSNISVYPNPTNGLISIENETSFEAKLYDLLGKEISFALIQKTETKQIIDLNENPNGVYFLHIKSGENKLVKKISLVK